MPSSLFQFLQPFIQSTVSSNRDSVTVLATIAYLGNGNKDVLSPTLLVLDVQVTEQIGKDTACFTVFVYLCGQSFMWSLPSV